jgi:hypothetical protein
VLLPQGIVDPHVHLLPAGLLLQRLLQQDSGITSQQEFTARVALYSDGLGPEQWVLGGGWDEAHWGGQLPDISWIDQVGGWAPQTLLQTACPRPPAPTHPLQAWPCRASASLMFPVGTPQSGSQQACSLLASSPACLPACLPASQWM